MAGAALPRTGGTYALLVRLNEPLHIRIGMLGDRHLSAMDYLYTGSAFGPGGLSSRISRHLGSRKTPHWHIDRLTQYADVIAVFYTTDPAPLECRWSQALFTLDQTCVPVSGFGSSDCSAGCPAHLVGFNEPPDQCAILDVLLRTSDNDPVYIFR